jgi:hypothetical protein
MRRVWTICLLGALAGAASAGAGAPEPADPPLRAMVSPHFGRAPAIVRIQAIVPPAAENRGLVIVLDSGQYYRSSAIPLEGDAAARVHTAEFRSIPVGEHAVTVTLVDRGGGDRATVRDVIRIMD